MTEPEQKHAEGAPRKPTRREGVARLRQAIREADPGTLAALRRYAGDSLPPPAFYHLAVAILDEQLQDAAEGRHRDEVDTRWAVLASAMASAEDFLRDVPLGEAMARAGVAEMRVLRLLEASPKQLPDLVRTVVHQLVQKGQAFDPNDLADLLLAPTGEKSPRSRIARSYYRHQGQ